MVVPLDIAPKVDIIIGLGENEGRKLVRASTAILRAASPVFNVMLSSSFREGNTSYDREHPLELCDDDGNAMVDLFLLMHFKKTAIAKTEGDWLQKFAIVCDKYRCAENFAEFFTRELEQGVFNAFYRLNVHGTTGAEEEFNIYSQNFVKRDGSTIPDFVHKDLLFTLPDDTIDDLKSYRRHVYSQC